MGKLDDKQREKIDEFIKPKLEPGEHVVAVLGTSQTGPKPSVLFPFVQILAGITGGIKQKGVVVTSSRVLMLRVKGGTSTGVRQLEETYPKDTVSVTEFEPGSLWSRLVLAIGGESLKLNVPKQFRDSAEQLVQALGGVKAPA